MLCIKKKWYDISSTDNRNNVRVLFIYKTCGL